MDVGEFEQAVARVEAVIDATAPGSALVRRYIGPIGHQLEVRPATSSGLPVGFGFDGDRWHVWAGAHLYERETDRSFVLCDVIGTWLPRLIAHGAIQSTWWHGDRRLRGRLLLLGEPPMEIVDISYALLARRRSRRPDAVRVDERFEPYRPAEEG